MPDHVHMLISIPPKYSVAQIIGYMKGKSSIWIAQNVRTQDAEFYGPQILSAQISSRWLAGTLVIRGLVTNQELADQQLEQFELKSFSSPKSNQSSKHPLDFFLAVPNQTSSFAGGYWLSSLTPKSSALNDPPRSHW